MFFKFNFFYLLVFGFIVVMCDLGLGVVLVWIFGGNMFGLWYFGGYVFYFERNKKFLISLL